MFIEAILTQLKSGLALMSFIRQMVKQATEAYLFPENTTQWLKEAPIHTCNNFDGSSENYVE